MNECWEKGQMPKQWKTAKIIMIPKPGKKLNLDNLRPISLTSCIGKLFEHVILTRLTNYMEDNELFPHTMVGFRAKLSTQDIMLKIKHQIIDAGFATQDTKVIVGLDLKKAFDNTSHKAILENLQELGVGKRVYDYIKDFLTNRTARIIVGERESQEFSLGSKGTPQGSVLSPFLFNVAMIGFPTRLKEITGLHHSLYADDITLWVAGGSDGHIEETLQTAVNIVEEYVAHKGLECSPEKSELLFYNPTCRGRKSNKDKPNIKIYIGDKETPTVESIRILGLRISSNGHNGETIRLLESSAQQIMRLIKRIANRHYGMKENNMIRLVQAFVISRIVYVIPYLRLQVAEREKIERIIRRVFKQAIGLPITTSNEKLLELGLHNTSEELIEAQRIAQYERLTQSKTGRSILEELGINYTNQFGFKKDIPYEIRKCLVILPIPKNMHPDHHQARRAERAKNIHNNLKDFPDTTYVDEAKYKGNDNMTIAVVDYKGNHKVSGSVRTSLAEEAEEAAIALAIAATSTTVIISDSQTAVRNFARGRISKIALRILAEYKDKRTIDIIWAPRSLLLARQ